jgi:hypothetical protein
MSLTKGFLKPANPINKYYISTGIVLWIATSYFLYAFFYYFREAFRIFTSHLGGRLLLILNPGETFAYNLFYAALATAIGYMLCLKFILENSYFRSSPKNRNRIRHTLHEQGVFTWTFLWVFSKTAFVLGLWYLSSPLQYEIDFINEFSGLFVLLPVVLFLSTWPQLSRTIGHDAIKWLGVISVIFVGISLILSNINFLDSKQVNESLLQKSVFHTHKMELPRSKTYEYVFRRYLYENIYLVLDDPSSGTLKLIDKDGEEIISFEQLNNYINDKRKYLFWDEQHKFFINLIVLVWLSHECFY